MKKINYQKEVKKVYPNAELKTELDIYLHWMWVEDGNGKRISTKCKLEDPWESAYDRIYND